MSPGVVRLTVLLAVLAGLGLDASLLTRPLAPIAIRAQGSVSGTEDHDAVGPVARDSVLRVAMSRAPFRATRQAAAVAFDPNAALNPEHQAPPPPPKPSLVVTGLTWGTDPQAIVEGFPGLDGALVVRPGERVGALRIRRVEPGRVVITGMDTTWVLEVRTPWQ